MADTQSIPILSVICPITRMSGRLHSLRTWLPDLRDKDVEVFLIHDVQDSNTGVEIRELVKELHLNFVYLSEGIYGTAGAARNSAFESLQGKWICFWDSDDVPNTDAVLKELDDNFDVIIGNYKEVLPDGTSIEVSNLEQGADIPAVAMNPGLWRFLFKHSLIENLRFPEFKLGEDQGFLAQIDWSKIRTKFVPKRFYSYFTGSQLQATAPLNSRDSLVDSIDFLIGLLRERIGMSSFIQVLIARQTLTILKTKNLHLILLALSKLSRFLLMPRLAFKQLHYFLYVAKRLLVNIK